MLFIITSGSYSDYAWIEVIDTTKEELEKAQEQYKKDLEAWQEENKRIEEDIFGVRYSPEYVKKYQNKELYEKWRNDARRVNLKYPDMHEYIKNIPGKHIEIEEFWFDH